MNIDNFKEYAVIVNGGSGCFFQPATNDYTYILTAKHNIEKANGVLKVLSYFDFSDEEYELKELPLVELVHGGNYFPHDTKDVAILKIDYVPNRSNLVRADDIITDRLGYFLVGFPEARRKENPENKHKWFRPDEGLTIQVLGQGTRECLVPGNPGHEEIIGHSGAGLVKLKTGKIILAGIQNKMVDADEQLGKIEFSPLDAFDEIIASFGDTIKPIIPAHLGCFSFLEQNAFKLEVDAFDVDNISFVRNLLREKAREVVESKITPTYIKDLFGKSLIIENGKDELLQNRPIWIAWLELLAILNIVKDKVHKSEDLHEIFNSYRLFYSSTTEDWTYELQNLIYADYKHLGRDGVVIVSTDKKPVGAYEFPKNKIPLTTRAVDKARMRTNEGIKFPFDHYRFIHASAFENKCIVEKLEEYVALGDNEIELMKKLKLEYNEFFRK